MSASRVKRALVVIGVMVAIAAAAAASAAAAALEVSDQPGRSTGIAPIEIVTPPDAVTPKPFDSGIGDPTPRPPLRPDAKPTESSTGSGRNPGESAGIGPNGMTRVSDGAGKTEIETAVDAPPVVVTRVGDGDGKGGASSGGSGSGSSRSGSGSGSPPGEPGTPGGSGRPGS